MVAKKMANGFSSCSKEENDDDGFGSSSLFPHRARKRKRVIRDENLLSFYCYYFLWRDFIGESFYCGSWGDFFLLRG